MKYSIHILSAALSVALMAGCSIKEIEDGLPQEVGSSLNKGTVPEGWFVATFSTSATRAETDFIGITGEDPRVFDLRYLIYEADGDFVKERLIFDDFDADTDDTQDWPLPSITDTLPVGHYKAVFIANTDPDLFRRKDADDMPLPDDMLTDYKLGFDQARLNMPYLLGANDPDFFMDVIEFSHEDSDETVYLQRVVGVFKAYRSLVDIQEGLNYLVGDLIENLTEGDIIEKQVDELLPGLLGGVLDGVTDLLPLDFLLNAILDAIVDPIVNTLYDYLLEYLVNQIGGLLEGNNGGDSLLDILDPLLNPWYFAEGAAVTVANQPTQFGFDMEVKARDTTTHTYYLPITTVMTDGEEKRVVITKYMGFADIDNDGVGEELMTLKSINAAVEGLVGGVLLDHVVENDYLLKGALFDITDPLDFYAPGNLQVYNEYSLADLAVDDYDQKGEGLTLDLSLGDVADLDDALDVLNIYYDVPLSPIDVNLPLGKLVGKVVLDRLLALDISVPINLPLLNLDNLDVAGGWDPHNTEDDTPDTPVVPPTPPAEPE